VSPEEILERQRAILSSDDWIREKVRDSPAGEEGLAMYFAMCAGLEALMVAGGVPDDVRERVRHVADRLEPGAEIVVRRWSIG
jgi:hypothetical protein